MELFYSAVIFASIFVLSIIFFWLAYVMETSKADFNAEYGECPTGYTVIPSKTLSLQGETMYGCAVPKEHDDLYSRSGAGGFLFNDGKTAAILGFSDTNKVATINFANNMWLGKTGRCNKKRWAIDNKVQWDGLTNVEGNC